MPARRNTGGISRSSPTRSDDKEAYKLKRKRNNDAVKKTREKSKQTAQQRKENVEKLRKVNTQMEAKIEEMKSNVERLKEILLHNVEPEKHDQMIKQILEDPSDDDGDD